MKTGIFGGAFDPVHIGHVRAAEAFFDEIKLDRLYILPNLIPPFKKQDFATAADRLEMLKIAFKNKKNIIIDDFELKNKGISYTYKTIQHYKELSPEDDLFLLIGDDNMVDFEKWAEFRFIIENCTLCVANRTGEYNRKIKEYYEQNYRAKISLLRFKPVTISSTELRGKISPEYLPSGVFEYINQKGLYE